MSARPRPVTNARISLVGPGGPTVSTSTMSHLGSAGGGGGSKGKGKADSAPARRACPYCRGTDFEADAARGDTVCVTCGAVLEMNSIVSEVTFQESSGGTSSVIGQFVPASGTKSLATAGKSGAYKESREVTILNGKRKINQVAATLKLNQNRMTQAAERLFLLAVERNFIQGRKTEHVVAACLYIVCRREKTPHMLLDFSDVLQTNVYVLGHCFLRFVRLLNISLPLLDPALYIHRFASKLEFGDKTHLVAITALRLVARMKRDWIQEGRRPAGICGACLLMAARLHGFQRTQSETIQVVRTCTITLRKRMAEFAMTPSGSLTLEQFQKGAEEDLPVADPPSFTTARLATAAATTAAAATAAAAAAAEAAIDEDTEEVRDPEAMITSVAEAQSVAREMRDTMRALREGRVEGGEGGGAGRGVDGAGAGPGGSSEDVRSIAPRTASAGDALVTRVAQHEADVAAAHAVGRNILMSKSSSASKDGGGSDNGNKKSGAGAGDNDVDKNDKNDGENDDDAADDDDKSEISVGSMDTDEEHEMLLTPAESRAKSDLWNDLFREYEAKQREKARIREENGLHAPPQKRYNKRKRVNIHTGEGAAEDAAKATQVMLAGVRRKTLSSKVNYEVLSKIMSLSKGKGTMPPPANAVPPASSSSSSSSSTLESAESKSADAGRAETVEPERGDDAAGDQLVDEDEDSDFEQEDDD